MKASSDSIAPTSSPSIHSWRFWKKRLARVSIVGGLALLVTQVLPAIPQEQRIEVRAPDGYELVDVQVAYSEGASAEILGGTHIHPPTPARSVVLDLNLRSGSYSMLIAAELVPLDEPKQTFFLKDSRKIELSGTSRLLHLPAP